MFIKAPMKPREKPIELKSFKQVYKNIKYKLTRFLMKINGSMIYTKN